MLPPDRRPATATLILLASLYCAQGLPSGLLAHSLPVLLRQHGVDLALIGLLKLLALPWLLKVLWAPWVDRLASPRLGHHRGWILPLQLGVITVIATLALMSPERLFDSHFFLLIGLLLLVNLAASTQDIATDGLAVRLLPERWRGLGNSLQVGGYKVGMLVSGSGLLLAMDALGWNLSVALVALLLVLMTLPIWRFNERRELPFQPAQAEPAGPGLLLRHYRGLLLQPGMLFWLAVLLSFKLGDALGSPMIKPMLVDQGWSNAELGQLTLISSLAGIAGALLGGLLYARIGVLRALILFGAVQITMFALGWKNGEQLRPKTAIGMLLAFSGLIILLAPGGNAPPLLSALAMTIAGIAWGIYSILGRRSTNPLKDTAGNFLRSVPLVVLAALVTLAQGAIAITPTGAFYAAASGVLASGAGYAVWYAVLGKMRAQTAATLQLSVPVLASVAGVVFLGEGLSTRLTIASVIVLGGIGLALVRRRQVP